MVAGLPASSVPTATQTGPQVSVKEMWAHLHHAHEVLDRRLQRLHLLALGPLLDLRRLRREALPLLRPYLLHPTHPVAYFLQTHQRLLRL